MERRQKRPKSQHRTGWRAIFIGLLLIPPNAYWIASGEATSTTVSLFFNVIFILFVLLLINLSVKRILPNVALNQGELLIVYVMLSISSGIAGLDMMRVLMAVLAGPFGLQVQRTSGPNFSGDFSHRG